MEDARLGGALRHFLHIGNLGEGQALDEEQLRGEPLVGRQVRHRLRDRQRLVGHAGGGLRFVRRAAVTLPRCAVAPDRIGTAAAQDAEAGVPFGPLLIAGVIIAQLVGWIIIDFYAFAFI